MDWLKEPLKEAVKMLEALSEEKKKEGESIKIEFDNSWKFKGIKALTGGPVVIFGKGDTNG